MWRGHFKENEREKGFKMSRLAIGSTVNYSYVSLSPRSLSGLCGDSAEYWRSLGVAAIHPDFVGSKREMSPNRARHLFSPVWGYFVISRHGVCPSWILLVQDAKCHLTGSVPAETDSVGFAITGRQWFLLCINASLSDEPDSFHINLGLESPTIDKDWATAERSLIFLV